MSLASVVNGVSVEMKGGVDLTVDMVDLKGQDPDPD